MLSFLAPVLVFGLVVFVHELGHFLAAKATGVYAPRFSIGFGPALWRRRRGETEYVVAAFPLGGYVRMASRHDEEAAILEGGSEEKTKRAAGDPGYDPNAMIPFGPKPVPEHRWFESKSLAARLVIMIAGVTMNFLLAIVVLGVLAAQMGRAVIPTTVVGEVEAVKEVPQLVTSVRPGDTIRAVNGQPVSTWNGVVTALGEARGDTVRLTTQRGAVTLPLGKGGSPEQVARSLSYRLPPVLDSVVPGKPGAVAGLRKADRVVAIDGVPVSSWPELVRTVSRAPGRELLFRVDRNGAPLELRIRPESARGPDPETGAERLIGRVGALPIDIVRRERVGPLEAAQVGWSQTWRMTSEVIGFLGKLFTGQLSVRQLGGPVAITRASVSAAQSGVADLFYLIAFLSVNVAILNLLPIPILDGGQIVLNVIEAAKGSPFSLRTREYILRFGLAAIGLLFVIVMFNDLTGLLGRLFG